MSNNKITLLPDNFGDLNKLINMDLSDNELLNFPKDQIDVLASLLHLNISKNHIDQMPIEFPYLYRLKVLRAASNDLKSIPSDMDKMKSLEVLDISDNIIESLPEKICKMPELKEINVSENKITRGWPKAWENLRQKIKVENADQDSFKERQARERPSDKVAETQVSPKSAKRGKKKVSPIGTPPIKSREKSAPVK